MGGSNGQQMPQIWTGASNAANATGASSTPVANSQYGGIVGSASNALGRTGDTMQNFFAGKLGTGSQPRPDYNPQKQQQQNQNMKDLLGGLLGKVGQTASPYDRAAKSQSDSASAWSAMQRGSGDGSGSLEFSSTGAYSTPETGEEKVSQGWANAMQSLVTSAAGAAGQKFANKTG